MELFGIEWDVLLSTEAIHIKDLEDPKIEAFVYGRFFVKNQVKLPQSASVELKNHCLKETRCVLWLLSNPVPSPPLLKYSNPWYRMNEQS